MLEIILMLLMLIVISNVVYKKVPFISLPLVQIVTGMLLWAILGTNLQPDSDFFMLLFIAPILYMDGEHISNHELLKYKTPIILMAIGLVFSTIIVVGAFVHWMIPGIPYAAGFALAAVLSPTDAVAVKAISNRIHLPHDVIMIVEGESLLNDASGLVAFNFAIAAAVTGAFSAKNAAVSFVYIAFCGILFGAIGQFVISFLTQKLKNMGVEDAPVFTLIQILTPFVIYYVTDELGFSGVLAVVAAGIVHSIHPYTKMSAKDAKIKYVSDGTWITLLFVLNGLIFLLLGIELPSALKNSIENDQIDKLALIGYVLAISVVLIFIRFVWTFIFVKKGNKDRLHNSVLTALSGARGAVTLAACFSIPVYLSDGSLFPQRDLLLFISSGVIIVMLLISNFILPVVAPKPVHDNAEAVKLANKEIIRATIARLKDEINETNKLAAYSLISHYEGLLIDRQVKEKTIRTNRSTESEILLIGLEAEKKEIERLMQDGTFDKEVLHRINDSIDRVKIRLSKQTFVNYIKYNWIILTRRRSPIDTEKIARTKMITIEAALKAISQNINPDNDVISKKAIGHYTSIFESISHTSLGAKGREYVEMKRDLEYKAIQVQKNTVQAMLETGEITHSIASTLRKYIRYAELAMVSEDLL